MGSSTTVQTSAPAPQSVQSSMADYVASLPALYQTQMQYEPQMQAMNLSMLQQYGQQFGEAYKNINEAMYPETAALQENLAQQATTGMEQGLSPEEMAQYRDLYASNIGTNAGSGIGADYMSSNLLAQDIARKDYYRNLGLSVAGRQPLATGGTTSQLNYMQGYQPQQALNYNANTYGNYAGSFQSAYQPSPWASLGGSAIGATGTALGGWMSGWK